jgi:hypothetical protein
MEAGATVPLSRHKVARPRCSLIHKYFETANLPYTLECPWNQRRRPKWARDSNNNLDGVQKKSLTSWRSRTIIRTITGTLPYNSTCKGGRGRRELHLSGASALLSHRDAPIQNQALSGRPIRTALTAPEQLHPEQVCDLEDIDNSVSSSPDK